MSWNKKSDTERQLHKDIQYYPLEELQPPTQASSHKSKLRPNILFFAFGIATTLILTILYLHFEHHAFPTPKYLPDTIPDEEWNHCGRSSKVAMEKGCIMEPLFYGWMPPQCVYPSLSARFPVFEDRTWYKDRDLSIPIPSEELWNGEHDPIYTRK
jgi:hypothetical protein